MTITKPAPPYSILITDDDPACRESLRDVFEVRGYHTHLASSGEEALDIVQRVSIHLALLDMHMPNMTGLETIQLVREVNAVLPCILVTADASEGLRRQALLSHAYSVVPKPINKNVVLYVVVRALGRAYGGPADAAEPPKPAT